MIEAVLFDQDGVIVDTERDGHRVAFNEAFREAGLGIEWDADLYHRLLQVGGGKERIRHYFETLHRGTVPEPLDALVKELHARKTDIFLRLLGAMPLRPGIRRFMREIRDRGLGIGICTTSNEKVARIVAGSMLADIGFDLVLAGDMVAKKKPDPEIYLTAIASLGVAAGSCLVVEDSAIGVAAARASGCRVLATVNGYTKDEDVWSADFVVSCLGDEEGERAEILSGSLMPAQPGVIRLGDILRALGETPGGPSAMHGGSR